MVVPKKVQKKAGSRGRVARPREKKRGRDPADLLKAWQKAIREVGVRLVCPGWSLSELARLLQHQAELVQQVLQRQLEFERELLNRAAAPVHATLELMDQAVETLRAQAISFRTAATTFRQLASLMDQQADLLQRAGATMRDPLSAVRSRDE